MEEPIRGFIGQYRWLSNFWVEDFILDGLVCKTAEHAYQAAKATNEKDVHFVLSCTTPGAAKRAGRKIHVRPDWEDMKLEVMRTVVWTKFSSSEDLQRRLLTTGMREIVEENYWNDTFWGVCRGKGTNWLGKILMTTRYKLALQAFNGDQIP